MVALERWLLREVPLYLSESMLNVLREVYYYDKDRMSELQIRIEVKEIFAVLK